MAVRTNTADKQVDAAGLGNHLLIVAALSLQVLGISIQYMDILFRTVDVVEQVAGHKRVIALRVVLGKSHILVHIKSQYVLE